MVPIEASEELTQERTQAAAQAAASLRAEGLAIGPEAEAISERWTNGEISTTEMRTLMRELHLGK